MKEQKPKNDSDSILKKSIPDLLRDFNIAANEAYLNVVPRETQIILDAQRCMVAMMAKVAISSNRMSWFITILTAAILALTLVLATK
jgi:hypothetical protein